MKAQLEPTAMAGAVLVFCLSTIALAAGLEPLATWYYSLAWWSYIAFADAYLSLRRTPMLDGQGKSDSHRRSILLRSPGAPRLLGLSVVIWLSFEIYNLRLGNWHYLGIPSSPPIRWAGYAVAYATVLPGLFITAELLALVSRRSPSARLALSPAWVRALFWGGLAGSVLPWLWPRYCFPLVWLAPTAFFAAVNHRLGGEGILQELGARGPGKLYRLLGAGAICGLLWELWNFWARAKWVYDIPFFHRFPLFEMPLTGFLGFPPFAVECHEMYLAGDKLLGRLAKTPAARVAAWLGLAAYAAAAFWAIDRFTVWSFAG